MIPHDGSMGRFVYVPTSKTHKNINHSWIGKYTVRPMGIRHGVLGAMNIALPSLDLIYRHAKGTLKRPKGG